MDQHRITHTSDNQCNTTVLNLAWWFIPVIRSEASLGYIVESQ